MSIKNKRSRLFRDFKFNHYDQIKKKQLNTQTDTLLSYYNDHQWQITFFIRYFIIYPHKKRTNFNKKLKSPPETSLVSK